ncbi:MAG: RNA ligase family protein [Polyangiaceae bacterium]|nr:RNA ligase family protein [Polyangiaceae bacterium]
MRRPASVEEKLDGACLGISVGDDGALRAQNRGGYLEPGGHPQFRRLWGWLAERHAVLEEALGQGLILFGEWCYARHTVAYGALPDWFLAFDVYEREAGRFWSRVRRDELAGRAGVATVPLLAAGSFDRVGIERLFGRSRFGPEPMEGVYLRWDEGDWLVARAKVVRRGWVQPDEEHWARRAIIANRLEGGRP